MATTTINLSSSLRSLSSPYSRNAPTLSSYSHPLPSFPSLTSRPRSSDSLGSRSFSLVAVAALGSISEAESVSVPEVSEEIPVKFPLVPGVYAVYDRNEELQFIGITRNIAASVLAHQKSVPELCGYVKFIGITRNIDVSVLAHQKSVPELCCYVKFIGITLAHQKSVPELCGYVKLIGITQNIAASVLAHQKLVPELCCYVKVEVVDEPDRAALTQAWKTWMEEHIKATGKVPPGNESGNATWVRQAPKKKPDLRLTPGRHVQLTVQLEDLIDRLVKENKVVAFIKGSRSAPMCGFSQKVVGILESEGVDYESIDVLDEEYNPGLRETLKKYSSWPTFPQVFVNGELLGGCDILSSMHETGELACVFKKGSS